MQIKMNCPMCGHTYVVGHSVAGMRLKCQKCGGTMAAAAVGEPRRVISEAPAAAAGPTGLTDPDDTAAVAPPPIEQAPVFASEARAFDVFRLGAADRHRKLAGIISVIMGALVYVCALVALVMAFGVGSIGRDQVLPAASLGMVTTFLGIASALGLALGTTYLVCGLKIGGEGYTSVLVALNVGLVHGILMLALVVALAAEGKLLMAASAVGTSLSVIVGLVFVIALGALVYFASRVLQVRR